MSGALDRVVDLRGGILDYMGLLTLSPPLRFFCLSPGPLCRLSSAF